MSIYVDPYGYQQSRGTVTVLEDARKAQVTYRNDTGKRFRVAVRQRPNPIGFHVRLPGDSGVISSANG